MGKQRTPQGQRPGRRGPVPRVPAVLAAPGVAEAPPEAITEAEPAMDQDSVEQYAPQAEAETLEAASAVAEAPAEAVSEEPIAAEEPAAETEAEAEPAAAEPEVAAAPPEEPAAAGAPEGEPAASDAEHAEEPALEAAPSEPLLPVAAFAGASPVAVIASEPPARTTFRFAFAPARIDVEGIGVVLANYVHNESVAALSHMRALSAARSPAEMIRLNVTEMQRAADASLTCWSDIARRAARSVPLH